MARAGIQAEGIPSFGSLENLIKAYSAIYRYLKYNYGDASKLRKDWGYLANKVVFIQISTDVSSALKIFEIINERGVGLNPMYLVENLLFTQVSQAQFTQLKDKWKKLQICWRKKMRSRYASFAIKLRQPLLKDCCFAQFRIYTAL